MGGTMSRRPTSLLPPLQTHQHRSRQRNNNNKKITLSVQRGGVPTGRNQALADFRSESQVRLRLKMSIHDRAPIIGIHKNKTPTKQES
jgi:hypothetical protein